MFIHGVLSNHDSSLLGLAKGASGLASYPEASVPVVSALKAKRDPHSWPLKYSLLFT